MPQGSKGRLSPTGADSTSSVKQLKEKQTNKKADTGGEEERRVTGPLPDVSEKNGSEKGASVHGTREGACHLSTNGDGLVPHGDGSQAWKKKSMAATRHDAGDYQDHFPAKKTEEKKAQPCEDHGIRDNSQLPQSVGQSASHEPC